MGDRGHNRHGPKEGAAVPLSQGGRLGPPSNTTWSGPSFYTAVYTDRVHGRVHDLAHAQPCTGRIHGHDRVHGRYTVV